MAKKIDWKRVNRQVERNMERSVQENDAIRNRYSPVNSRNRQTRYGREYSSPVGTVIDVGNRAFNKYFGNRKYKYKNYEDALKAAKNDGNIIYNGKIINKREPSKTMKNVGNTLSLLFGTDTGSSNPEERIEPVRDKKYNIVGYNVRKPLNTGVAPMISMAGNAVKGIMGIENLTKAERIKLATRAAKANTVRKAANATKAIEKAIGKNISEDIMSNVTRYNPVKSIYVGKKSRSVSAPMRADVPGIKSVSNSANSSLVNSYERAKNFKNVKADIVKPNDFTKVSWKDDLGVTRSTYIDSKAVPDFYSRKYSEAASRYNSMKRDAIERNADYYNYTSPSLKKLSNKMQSARREVNFVSSMTKPEPQLSIWAKTKEYLARRKAARAAKREEQAAQSAANAANVAPQNVTGAAETQTKPGFWARRKAARAAKREERLAKDERRSRLETPFGFRQMWRGRPVYKDEKFVGRSKFSGKNILMYGVPTGIGATMAIKGINRYIDKSPSYTPKSNIDQRNQTQQIRQISEVPNSSQNTEYVPEDTVTNVAPQDTTAAVREEVVEQAPQREENSNNNVEQTNNSNNNVQQTNNSRTAPVNNNATVRNARAATRQNRRRNRMTNNYNAARRLKASLSFNPSSDQDLLYMNEADQRYQAAKNYLDSKDNPSDEDIKFATEVSPELKQEMDNEAAVRRQEATDEMINALDEERRRRGESFRFGGKIYKRR